MDEKYLPIKIIEKRLEVDERQTEGSGSDDEPKWVLSGQELKNKSKVLFDDVMKTSKITTKKLDKYHNVPAVIKAKLQDVALAKSHRDEILNVFDSQQERVIGMAEDNSILVRIDKVEDFEEIKKNLSAYERNAKAVSAVNAIDVFQPKVERVFDKKQKDKYIFKVKLINYNNNDINNRVLQEFKKLCLMNNKCEINKSVKYSSTLTVHEVTADSVEDMDFVYDFSSLLSVEPMPFIEVMTDDFFPSRQVTLNMPVQGKDYPIVGVLDTGIAKISSLRPWVIGEYSSYPHNYVNEGHGTFVAGIIGFGDYLEGKSWTGVNGCKMFDATVFPDPTKERCMESDLVENIREAIKRHGDKIKVWNMSLGTRIEISLGSFSDFGIALDSIQDEYDVLIIKSASNCSNFLSGLSRGRIARGADSVRALTIGSIAQGQSETDLVEEDYPSPFTRVGPGPSYIIKPELTHYGGNAGVSSHHQIIPNGVISLGTDGCAKTNCGTSFSTPRVTSIVADLHHKIKDEFDPLLLKGLVMHSGSFPSTVDMKIDEKINHMGFGVPKAANEILFNDAHEITLVIRDNLIKGEFVEILDFPYPKCLIDDEGYYFGQIAVTLVNNPYLAENEGPEYCQSNLDIKIGTYDEKKRRDTTKRNIKNPLGRAGGGNVLNAGFFSKRKATGKKKVFVNSEKVLLQYGDKFYPNKKYVVDLNELTMSNKERLLRAPKKWYLKITGLFRKFIENQAQLKREELSQEYCVVITIRDPSRTQPVYNDVANQLKQYNFIHKDIQIRQEIDIRTNR